MKNLILEKRGCNFWTDCQENRDSDLENFRLFGYIDKAKKKCIEVCTSTRKKSKYSKFLITKTHIDYQFETKNGTFGDLSKCGYCNGCNKIDVLEFVNRVFSKHFENLVIVDRL